MIYHMQSQSPRIFPTFLTAYSNKKNGNKASPIQTNDKRNCITQTFTSVGFINVSC